MNIFPLEMYSSFRILKQAQTFMDYRKDALFILVKLLTELGNEGGKNSITFAQNPFPIRSDPL